MLSFHLQGNSDASLFGDVLGRLVDERTEVATRASPGAGRRRAERTCRGFDKGGAPKGTRLYKYVFCWRCSLTKE